jgi:hypothetical protein
MRHALVEILDIRINIGILLTDYAPPHRQRRLLEADAVQGARAASPSTGWPMSRRSR